MQKSSISLMMSDDYLIVEIANYFEQKQNIVNVIYNLL